MTLHLVFEIFFNAISFSCWLCGSVLVIITLTEEKLLHFLRLLDRNIMKSPVTTELSSIKSKLMPKFFAQRSIANVDFNFLIFITWISHGKLNSSPRSTVLENLSCYFCRNQRKQNFSTHFKVSHELGIYGIIYAKNK